MQRHTTGPRQMSRILEQAVGDIHRRGCPAPQSQPELALRTGLPETPGKIVAAPGIQLLRKRLSQYHCQSRRAIKIGRASCRERVYVSVAAVTVENDRS